MKEQVVEETQTNSGDKEIRLSSKLLYSLFGVVALAILIICKICASFGVTSSTFYGIMSIFIYVLPFLGIVFNYVSNQKLTNELWLNVVVLALALMS